LTTYNFIQPIAPAYSQFKNYSFKQYLCDRYNIVEDCKRLRLYFNKQFEEMLFIKQREMNFVREGADRIRHICSELELMFDVLLDSSNVFPVWNIKETPEKIIEFTEDEIETKPYISPSLQDLYNKQVKLHHFYTK
jgi:hypothetical protein